MPTPLRIVGADADAGTRDAPAVTVRRLGHEVSAVARTGRELVAHCRRATPDLILTDVRMPDMTGLEAVAAVGRSAFVPAVLVTAFPSRAGADEALPPGCWRTW